MAWPRVDSLAAWRGLHRSGRPAKLSIDAEVRAFADELLASSTFRQVADACREKFGAERAPSKSAVHRYWREQQNRHAPLSPKATGKPQGERPKTRLKPRAARK